ncbi:MAG: ZPR1 zinc finger domain-containing protein [Crenarchaeota archaeon]|nr:ZPR1 zinc finger domain-containing protein [Thermoproteota archaeon]
MEIPEHVNLKLLREEIVKCPMCGKNSLKVSIYSYDMPMIGPVIFVVGKCSECGYKFVDIKTFEAKGDQKIEFKVESEKDLNTMVLRSATATLEIPELQAEIAPGPASHGFLTTVEGVLQRFKDIIEYLCKDAADEKEKAECEKRLEMIKEMLEGKRKFTIVIRDPEGHSKIASERAKEEIRRPEEGKGG